MRDADASTSSAFAAAAVVEVSVEGLEEAGCRRAQERSVRHVTTVSPQHLEVVCQRKVVINSLHCCTREDTPSKLQPLEGLQLLEHFTVHIEGYVIPGEDT
uniref:Uncharacterized protein n=1 Tax=Oryza glumipatula TaxID=40148 RepID=A0A0E0B7F8_9ORYZ